MHTHSETHSNIITHTLEHTHTHRGRPIHIPNTFKHAFTLTCMHTFIHSLLVVYTAMPALF